jgi:hypothetical protein
MGLHYIYENIQQENIQQKGLHLRKYSTGVPTWAYIYENIQQGCLHRIIQGHSSLVHDFLESTLVLETQL